jgi:hypothetical protein
MDDWIEFASAIARFSQAPLRLLLIDRRMCVSIEAITIAANYNRSKAVIVGNSVIRD